MIVKRVLISVAAAILLEVLVFNFQTCCQSIRGAPQLTLETAQLTLQNWDKSETGEYTSLPDPMIYVEGLSMQVETIRIKTDMEPLPAQYTLFYTTEESEGFSGEKMLFLEPVTGDDQFELDMQVAAVRIDPGEEAGTVLHKITFVLNEAHWDISASRIVAMLVIWWGTAGLMALQKPVDYGIGRKQGDSDET